MAFRLRAEWSVDNLPFWPNCALSDKRIKIGRGRFVCFELIRRGAIGPWPQWSVGTGGLAHVQVWSVAETF